MHEQIQAIADDLQAIRARFERLMAVTSDDRWSRRADPKSWSVAECIAHLNLTSKAMQPLLEGALHRARAIGGPPPSRYRRSVFGAILGTMVGPLIGWGRTRFGRVRTPPPFVPSGELSRVAVAKEFLEHIAAHEATVRASDTLPLDRVHVESPFVKGAMYDAYSAWIVLTRHAHRHLAQAERVWA
jgi:hypothetical protein